VELRSGDKGRFEVDLDGQRVFSKAELKRHIEAGELVRLLEPRLGPPIEF
jgi:hypothetical protein